MEIETYRYTGNMGREREKAFNNGPLRNQTRDFVFTVHDMYFRPLGHQEALVCFIKQGLCNMK